MRSTAVFIVLLAGMPAAFAASTTSNLGVSMTVTAECTLNAGTLNFGSPARASVPVDATATLTVNCTNSAPYSIQLSNGSHHDMVRRMRRGTTADYVGYKLYTDSARGNLWEDMTAVSGTGNASDQTITVYGRVEAIPASMTAGTYDDVVVVTLNY